MEATSSSNMSGWLYCKRNLRKTWKKRYFALHNSYIDYYKSDKDLKTKCVIPLGLAICYTLFENETTRPYVCAIKTSLRKSKTYFLSAETLEDQERWVLSIRAAIFHTFSTIHSVPVPSASTDGSDLVYCTRRSARLSKHASISITSEAQISRPVLQSVSSRRRIALVPEAAATFLHGTKDKVAKNPFYNPDVPLEGEISLFVAKAEFKERNIHSKFLVFRIEIQYNDLDWTIFRTFDQFQSLDKKVGHLMWPRFKIPPRLGSKALALLSEKRFKRLSAFMTGYSVKFSQNQAQKRDLEAFYSFIKPSQFGDIKERGFDFSIFQ